MQRHSNIIIISRIVQNFNIISRCWSSSLSFYFIFLFLLIEVSASTSSCCHHWTIFVWMSHEVAFREQASWTMLIWIFWLSRTTTLIKRTRVFVCFLFSFFFFFSFLVFVIYLFIFLIYRTKASISWTKAKAFLEQKQIKILQKCMLINLE